MSSELIVLDNASGDGSADAIESEFGDQVKLIRSQCNLGFAAGNNAAAKNATGQYLLFLNPDTIVLNCAIYSLVDFAEARPDAGVWGGGRTVFADGSLNPSSCWLRQTLWSLASQALGLSSLFRTSSTFNPEGIGGWDRSGEREVDIVSGCFLLITRKLWQQLDGFHQDFFMYGEEADLCLRAKQLGSRPRVTEKATIIHYGGASETVRSDKLCRLLAAKMLLIDRHFFGPRKFLARRLLQAWPLSRMMAHRFMAPLRASSRPRAKVWGDVWAERSLWCKGQFKPVTSECHVQNDFTTYSRERL